MSTYYCIAHHFKIGKANEWWPKIQQAMSSPEAMAAMEKSHHDAGFHNHSFIPHSVEGPMHCIWEADEGKNIEDMQAFIDGPSGPSMGCLMNTCHKIDVEAAGQPPYPSFFQKAKGPHPVEMEYGERQHLIDLFDEFMAGLWTGEATNVCTADAKINPPGTPPMAIAEMASMLKQMAPAFPHWQGKTWEVQKLSDGTYTVLTQQRTGGMQADLPAVGPFPEVKFADAPALAKREDLNFPVERGSYTLSADGTKIAGGTYHGVTREVDGSSVTAEMAEAWGKKGDLSDVGFGALYAALGKTLPPPPKPEEKNETEARRVNGSRFFLVHHTFLAGRAQEWWDQAQELFGDPAAMGAMVEQQNAAGFHGHAFMPQEGGSEQDIFCLWEAKHGCTPDAFQTFIDGTGGTEAGGEKSVAPSPTMGCMNNICYEFDSTLVGGLGPVVPRFTQLEVDVPKKLKTKNKWKKLFKIFKSKKSDKGEKKATKRHKENKENEAIEENTTNKDNKTGEQHTAGPKVVVNEEMAETEVNTTPASP